MKANITFAVIFIILVVTFAMTLIKPTEDVVVMLHNAAAELRTAALVLHIIFIAVVVFGIAFRKARNFLFAAFIALISLTAVIAGIMYRLIPNVIVFGLILILTVVAYMRGKLKWDLASTNMCPWFIGLLALVFGFWYLHWVEEPVMLNALLFSPLGLVNCPTLLTISGFLILSARPRSLALESTVAFSTLYFGFYGVLKVAAYVDVVMILSALYMIFRIGTYFPKEEVAEL
jgi:hypothetical protein